MCSISVLLKHYASADNSGHQDVMGVLEDVCEESLQATNFFHGGPARNEAR